MLPCPAITTRCPPASLVYLIENTRSLCQALPRLLQAGDARSTLEIIDDVYPSICALSVFFGPYSKELDLSGTVEPVINLMSNGVIRGKLEGVKAHVYMGQVQAISDMVSLLRNRWNWIEATDSEGHISAEHLVRMVDRLPKPTCDPIDIAKLAIHLQAIDIPGARKSDVFPDKPLFADRPSPQSCSQLPDFGLKEGEYTFFAPGEEKEKEETKPDLVRVAFTDPERWVDITPCRRWILDCPYYLIPTEENSPNKRASYAFTRFDWPMRDKVIEFRFILHTDSGDSFALGTWVHQWYRDKAYHENGNMLLFTKPQFHREIVLINRPDRRLIELGSEEVLRALIDSGHSSELPEDLTLITNCERGDDPDLSLKPGYLGLILDSVNQEVGRQGWDQKIVLKGKLPIALLKAFLKSQDEYISRAGMGPIWQSADLNDMLSPQRVDTEISNLRKALKPLGIQIAIRKTVGWRLEQL